MICFSSKCLFREQDKIFAHAFGEILWKRIREGLLWESRRGGGEGRAYKTEGSMLDEAEFESLGEASKSWSCIGSYPAFPPEFAFVFASQRWACSKQWKPSAIGDAPGDIDSVSVNQHCLYLQVTSVALLKFSDAGKHKPTLSKKIQRAKATVH